MTARIHCPDCPRTFGSDNALAQHRKFTHRAQVQRRHDDDDESIASIAAEAEWKLDAGLPLDEFEASLVS